MGVILDGRAIARMIQSEVETEIAALKSRYGFVPGLAVVLVGDDPASRTYVNAKNRTCRKLGMSSTLYEMPADVSTDLVLAKVAELNRDQTVHGILIQLPLPPQVDAARVISQVDPTKDVDGLHPVNIGLLCSGHPRYIPCTPYGICELLARSGVSICGKEVVVIGRSNLVGRPLSILMSSKGRFGDATVTICHSRTPDIACISRRAEILIVAIGRRKFITRDMVRAGAVVVDVGIHPGEGPDEKLCGDVDFAEVSQVASFITPVPGGVGPMTIAMLMRNTADAAQRAVNGNLH